MAIAAETAPPKPKPDAGAAIETKALTEEKVMTKASRNAAWVFAFFYLLVVGVVAKEFVFGTGSDKSWERALTILNVVSAIGYAAIGVLIGATVQAVKVVDAKKKEANAKEGEEIAKKGEETAKKGEAIAKQGEAIAKANEEDLAGLGKELSDAIKKLFPKSPGLIVSKDDVANFLPSDRDTKLRSDTDTEAKRLQDAMDRMDTALRARGY